jgi:predicted nucleic acid-binding protein
MILYCDTSALIKLYVAEVHSKEVLECRLHLEAIRAVNLDHPL